MQLWQTTVRTASAVRHQDRRFRPRVRALAAAAVGVALLAFILAPAGVSAAGYCATFVADLNVPDGTTMNVNQGFTKSWRLRNCGGTAWNGVSVVRVGGNYGPTSFGVPGVGPNQNADLSASFTAPGSAGTYRATYQLKGPQGQFGQQFWVEIRVNAPPPPPTPKPAPTPAPPPNNSARIEMVKRLYREVLGREADQGGLNSYVAGGLSESQIRESMLGSSECRDKRATSLCQQRWPVQQPTQSQQSQQPAPQKVGNCECVEYIQNRFNLSIAGRVWYARDMGSHLKSNGFHQVSGPTAGAVVIFAANFGQGVKDPGHVGVVESYTTTSGGGYRVKVHGANQGGTGNEMWCTDVNTVEFSVSPSQLSQVTYWVR